MALLAHLKCLLWQTILPFWNDSMILGPYLILMYNMKKFLWAISKEWHQMDGRTDRQTDRCSRPITKSSLGKWQHQLATCKSHHATFWIVDLIFYHAQLILQNIFNKEVLNNLTPCMCLPDKKCPLAMLSLKLAYIWNIKRSNKINKILSKYIEDGTEILYIKGQSFTMMSWP